MIRIILKQKPLLEAANFSLNNHYLLLQVAGRNTNRLPDFLLTVYREGRPEKEVGHMRFGPHVRFNNIWHVMNVSADPGFGPVLYEAAMELAQKARAEGFAPDPTSVSEAARNVWRRYNDRAIEPEKDEKMGRVVANALPQGFNSSKSEDKTPRTPELFQFFSKAEPKYVDELIAKNRLRDRGSALKNFFSQDKTKLNENADPRTFGDLQKLIAQVNRQRAIGAAKGVALDQALDSIPGATLVKNAYQFFKSVYSKDEARKTGTWIDKLAVDKNYSAIVDDTVEENFLKKLSSLVMDLDPEMPLPNDYDINKELELFLKKNFQSRTLLGGQS